MSDLPVNAVTIHKDRELVQKALNKIEVDQYSIQKGADVIFLAGNEITLKEGFFAADSSDFSALLGLTLDTATNTHGRIENNSGNGEGVDFQTEKATNEQIANAFPNPFTDRLTLRYQVSNPGPVSIAIYDVTGRLVQKSLTQKYHDAGAHEFQVDASALTKGNYIFIIDMNTVTVGGHIVRK